jgi:hypothetical protein
MSSAVTPPPQRDEPSVGRSHADIERQPTSLATRTQAGRAHQSCNTMHATPMTPGTHVAPHARTAIGSVALLEARRDLQQQAAILSSSRTRKTHLARHPALGTANACAIRCDVRR